jgi:hypothetical protein
VLRHADTFAAAAFCGRMGSYPFYLDLSDRDVRDVLWLLASRWEEFRPDDTRTLRSLVGEHSTADECRERLCVGLEPEPDDPLPDEIAAQAAELRQGWADNHQVAAEDFDEATGIRVCCETDLSCDDSTSPASTGS